ncbi:hypothetical protein [Flavobacterium hungaricum]|uniref:Uncharacterized protein n=1 Tax=Flavobacterium hungaricum TaxID=2082725 RepID=A0ABR9TH03_9FLAO|nr:hypothetical protein [Flavobacterium hungaricum]MBE8724540.1 hypothetical protein [Flavobacterium hungaricum]
MKILFLCGSLEPGSDGVGDYTRRLAGELVRNGHQVIIVALSDNHVREVSAEMQQCEGSIISVLRIPHFVPSKLRYNKTAQYIKDFSPDWISLQFVPYSFNSKGLPFLLPAFLKKFKGKHKWHIMFHELWLGIDKEAPFKHKCIGRLQQVIIKNIIRTTRPNSVHTQNKLYQFFLKKHNIDAQVLPICGNIPLAAEKRESADFTQFVLFGSIHFGAPFKDFVDDLMRNSKLFIKPIKFIFIGKNGEELEAYKTTLENYAISYKVLGIQSENVISQVLAESDFGISTTPYFQTEKSGVYAAYREHRLSTICVARKWTPINGKYEIPQIIKYEKDNLNLIYKKNEVFDLQVMTSQFVNSISIL